MGGTRPRGGTDAVTAGEANADRELVSEIRAAYANSVDGWATGPAWVYRRLAVALVAAAREALTGRRVLDLGAGTGIASEVLHEIGARPVGLDLAVEMLTHRQARRPPGVAGDAQALPFRDDAFDAVVAAFSLNHVPDLERALHEGRRVVRPGGLVLASTFPNDTEHPAKAAVEGVLEQHGYRRPDWYATFKRRVAALTGDADAFAGAAARAGLTGIRVHHLDVDAGLDDPHVAAQWRLNMPHTLDFVAGLEPRARADLRAGVVAALPRELPGSVRMLTLRCHAP